MSNKDAIRAAIKKAWLETASKTGATFGDAMEAAATEVKLALSASPTTQPPDVTETAKRIAWEMADRLNTCGKTFKNRDELWGIMVRSDKERALSAAEAALRSPHPQPDAALVEALSDLRSSATTLRTCAPEVFPEVNEQGQVHFGRVLMESAAEAIDDYLRIAHQSDDAREQDALLAEFNALKEEGNGNG